MANDPDRYWTIMTQTLRQRITHQQLEDLYNRTRTVRDLARELHVSEKYLSAYFPERAPKKNPRLLKAAKEAFHRQLVLDYELKRISAVQAAHIASVSLRTFYRRAEKYKS